MNFIQCDRCKVQETLEITGKKKIYIVKYNILSVPSTSKYCYELDLCDNCIDQLKFIIRDWKKRT